MAVRLARIQNRKNGLPYWAYWKNRELFVLGPAKSLGETLSEFLKSGGPQKISSNPGQPIEVNEVQFLSPVTAPCQIICQGKNYLDHLLETGVQPKNKEFNLLFTKADSCLAPASGEVARPERVRLLDYELELGLVIGKDLTKPTEIHENNLHEYVAGIVMANDISARDVQIPERQWFKGKSFRGFCPVGPVLLLLEKEEFSKILDLKLELKVNGEVRQKSNTKLLMHKPADTLSEISKIFDMRVGDLLLTGTPGGVAMKVKAKTWWEEFSGTFKTEKEKFSEFIEEQSMSSRYLKSGDKIESTICSEDGLFDLGKQELVIR